MTAFAPISALLLGVAFLLMGNGLQGTLLPVRAQFEDFSTFSIGVMGASYYLGFAVGCLSGPYIVRRVGHIRTFAAMVSLASTVALAHAVIVTDFLWWPFRATTGLCFAVLFMVIESWLNEKSTNQNRGFVFSVYTIINLTVITVGQLMLTLADPQKFVLFAVASILVSLAALPVALTGAAAPQPISKVKIRLRHLFRCSPVGFIGAFAVGLANGAFWSLAPVYAQQSPQISGTEGIAFFMSAAVLGGALMQWPIGRLSDKFDRRKVIFATCCFCMIAAISIILFSQLLDRGLFALSVMFGGFAFPIYALSAAHMNDSVETGGFVEASSGLLLLFAAGAVVGPLIASTLMNGFGPNGLFVFTAAVHAFLAIFTALRMRKRGARLEEDREPFVDSARVAQTISTIDPLEDGTTQDSAADRDTQSTEGSNRMDELASYQTDPIGITRTDSDNSFA